MIVVPYGHLDGASTVVARFIGRSCPIHRALEVVAYGDLSPQAPDEVNPIRN